MVQKHKLFYLLVFSLLACSGDDGAISDPANTTEFYIVNNSNYEILVSAETDRRWSSTIDSVSIKTNDRYLFYSGTSIGFPTPQDSFSKFTLSIKLNNSITVVYSKIDNNEWVEEMNNGNKREILLEIDETKFEI